MLQYARGPILYKFKDCNTTQASDPKCIGELIANAQKQVLWTKVRFGGERGDWHE
jgi:hypothetical protein